MVAYDFYVNSYLGSIIPEKSFSGMIARAAASLERLRRRYLVSSPGADSEKMALCAMAEAIYQAQSGHDGISTARVGNVSVRYADKREGLDKELYRRAGIYLDIYRGVRR